MSAERNTPGGRAMAQAESPALHRGGPGSIPGRSMWKNEKQTHNLALHFHHKGYTISLKAAVRP